MAGACPRARARGARSGDGSYTATRASKPGYAENRLFISRGISTIFCAFRFFTDSTFRNVKESGRTGLPSPQFSSARRRGRDQLHPSDWEEALYGPEGAYPGAAGTGRSARSRCWSPPSSPRPPTRVPKGATPLRLSMVPAYNACATPNRTHGTPLAFPSCNPPVQSSTSLTVGSPDANGATANSVGSIRIAVIARRAGSARGLRREPHGQRHRHPLQGRRLLACGAANAADGADYTGELQGNAQIRITDHWNAVAPGGGPDAATVIDIPFPVNATLCGNCQHRQSAAPARSTPRRTR